MLCNKEFMPNGLVLSSARVKGEGADITMHFDLVAHGEQATPGSGGYDVNPHREHSTKSEEEDKKLMRERLVIIMEIK